MNRDLQPYVTVGEVTANTTEGLFVTDRTIYDSTFFSSMAEVSLRSARLVVPLVVEMLHPKSIIDVGCGLGVWLQVFAENGVANVHGIDGDYIDRSKLHINQGDFASVDLTRDFSIDAKYDLVVCLEVAEHLPAACAEILIQRLTSASSVVLFSAAIPGQGGTSHVNERWPEYWRSLFAKHDFVMFDPFRPQIRNDRRVAFWIRQNLFLFVKRGAMTSYPKLEPAETLELAGCEWVHVGLYEKWFAEATRTHGVKELLREIIPAIRRSIRRRLNNAPRVADDRSFKTDPGVSSSKTKLRWQERRAEDL
jgi:SAM-dependent methyltransferase